MSYRPPKSLQGLKVVLVHDWLTGMRGGEKVLEAFCRIFPDAPLFTLLHVPGSVSGPIVERDIHCSFVQKMPLSASRYRYYLPLFPRAVEGMRLPECDLVLSTSHCVAKGVRPPGGAVHVSYLHTPMRYIWDMYEAYFGKGTGGLAARVMPWVRPYLQRWDVSTCDRADYFLANSAFVAERIERLYGRHADVIHPPVEVERFAPALKPEDYYLVVSALVPYKRVDLAVKACQHLGRKLKVVGKGPEMERLKALGGPKTEFLGWQSDEAVAGLMARARAFLFPGEEDFGITPVESMAAGRPVIAFGQGGALETVVGLDTPLGRRPTGVFFTPQDENALAEAILRLEDDLDLFQPEYLRAHAAGFSTERFMDQAAAKLVDIMHLRA